MDDYNTNNETDLDNLEENQDTDNKNYSETDSSEAKFYVPSIGKELTRDEISRLDELKAAEADGSLTKAEKKELKDLRK